MTRIAAFVGAMALASCSESPRVLGIGASTSCEAGRSALSKFDLSSKGSRVVQGVNGPVTDHAYTALIGQRDHTIGIACKGEALYLVSIESRATSREDIHHALTALAPETGLAHLSISLDESGQGSRSVLCSPKGVGATLAVKADPNASGGFVISLLIVPRPGVC
jgi:hypothetical protein